MREFDQLGLGPNPDIPFGFAPDQGVMLAVQSIKKRIYEDNPNWFYQSYGGIAIRSESHRDVVAATLQMIADDFVLAPVDATIEIAGSPIWLN